MHRIDRILGYFSETNRLAICIADSASDTTATNFFGPIEVKTFSISAALKEPVWALLDSSFKAWIYCFLLGVIIKKAYIDLPNGSAHPSMAIIESRLLIYNQYYLI